ncbi:alpha/beta-hydrolase [Tothia fuscella]|uniref:Alpha/beta-hydrolase n=1 Tax=Tothia fuscella TaxID=1048955 RepID=A0A9P4NR19_9PEZI|nr:alpha/beta-hydrolase [Tothia fuscella]
MRLVFIVTTLVCLLTTPGACDLHPSSEQILLVQHDASTHTPSNRSISPSLFVELEELARIVDITYCVGALGLGIQKPFECPSRCKDFKGFELVTTWNTGPLLSDSCGYIALSHPPSPPRIIIAFRGTYSITNTVADLSSMPQAYAPYPGDGNSTARSDSPKCYNCTVHTGFYTSWRHTRDEILPHVYKALEKYPEYQVTLVGHSLGGAVAAFAALEMLDCGLQPTVTTFGEPRIGNAALTEYINLRFKLTSNHTSDLNNQSYRRVTHISDPVPLLPLDEWGYAPHGGEIFISNPDIPPEIQDIYHCDGNADPKCIVGPEDNGWNIPNRFKLWQLFFAHRDYFWRLGLCLPGNDFFWRGEEEAQLH